ncbi:hypothetical protein [Kocuria rosea]|uniref:hypothetical protein n=1 Tax=Kocuria rosea TaxID=1275 RepID=UPI003D352303
MATAQRKTSTQTPKTTTGQASKRQSATTNQAAQVMAYIPADYLEKINGAGIEFGFEWVLWSNGESMHVPTKEGLKPAQASELNRVVTSMEKAVQDGGAISEADQAEQLLTVLVGQEGWNTLSGEPAIELDALIARVFGQEWSPAGKVDLNAEPEREEEASAGES